MQYERWLRGAATTTLAVCVLAASGCAAMVGEDASSNGAATTMAASEDAKNAGMTRNKNYASDASGGGGLYTSADAGAGTPAPPTDESQGIGLKPGGAQDINFFRQKVGMANLPKPGDMTLEGWLNEHDTVLPKALPDRVVTLHALAAMIQPPPPAATANAEFVLQIGLNSGKKLADVTDPISLTVVLDRSGSMAGDKMKFVKTGLHALVAQLPKSTRFSFVSFSSNATTDLQPTDMAENNKIQADQTIDAQKADGGTNISGGLELGLQACKSAGADFKIKRILFLSDGLPSAGNTDPQYILTLAKQAAAAGCSISTVGVGFDFDPQLMTGIAQNGGGTGWFLPNGATAKQVFVQDLETLLLPVAQKLTLQFQLANGWKAAEIYGFDWAQEGNLVTIKGPKQAKADPNGKVDPPPDADPNQPQTAMPTLFASKRNGLVMVKLLPPTDVKVDDLANLLMATVKYSYTLAKSDKVESFEVPVQVPGMFSIPDGGLAYFASPIVRRAWMLLRAGLALQGAVDLAQKGELAASKAVLDSAVALLAVHKAMFAPAELALVDASQPDLADAAKLLGDLAALVK